jgi:hypothetical protein
MSLGYDILPTITRLRANTNIWLRHDATTPRCSKLGGCATLPQPVQPWVIVLSPAWLDNIVIGMTRPLHHAEAKSPRQRRCQHDSAALSLAWLNIYITPRPSRLSSVVANMTRQHCRQYDSTPTSHRGQSPQQLHRLNSVKKHSTISC